MQKLPTMKMILKVYYKDGCDCPEIVASPSFLKDYNDTKRLSILWECVSAFKNEHKNKAKIYCNKRGNTLVD